MDNSTIWKIINSHFHDNPQSLVRHHIDSYNDFYKNGIYQIFKEKNPIRLSSRFDSSIDDFRSQCNLYFGGKNGDKIYFGKPVIYDDNNAHYMFPNEARLRNMTYGMTIHYDVEVEIIDILEPGQQPTIIGTDLMKEVEGGAASLSEEGFDYSEADYAKGKPLKNYKESREDVFSKAGGNADVNELDGLDGGAPAKTIVKPRAKVPIEMTPAAAARLREATEKTMGANNTQRRTITLEKMYLGKFPIMLQSDFCILQGIPREVRHTMGECRNDVGGYFIIDGKEKTVVAQEKFADNMLYIRKSTDEKYLYSAEIRSVSENVSKPVRTLSVKIVAPTPSFTFKNIVVNIPNVRAPVPLFIVFRALGIISDKDIISHCLLDIEKYESMVDLFIPSVHDAASILTQQTALEYISHLIKVKTVVRTLEILSDYFLPHVGEINYATKAYALGNMVFRLLSVYTGLERPTDRDNFKYKRIELVGSLVYDLFREYYNIQQRQIHLEFEKILYFNKGMYENDLFGLIYKNHREVFRERLLEAGFKKAFKGNWGSQTHTKRIGIVQDLNRLSFNSALNHLRKTNLPLDSSVKLVGPRVLHNSQWGFIDPIDTPDGASIGLHKHLAISTYVTRGASREPIIAWLRERWGMKLVQEYSPIVLSRMTKVMINGLWGGSVDDPIECVKKFKLYRRNALIPIYTSATFDIALNTIFIYTDAGRLCRPIFYRDELTGRISYQDKDILKSLQTGEFTWANLITGFNKMRESAKFDINQVKMYELNELYEGVETETNPAKLERFLKKKAVIDYIDTSESENAMIALNVDDFEQSVNTKAERKHYTHSEIHESLIFGMMCNQIIFPENNPASRNSFSCGQSKQACSVYHTNYQVRMDKTAVLLNYGQIPLVKSRYLEYIHHEENPYGENAIVAIMCYTGYNVEDAILINEGALKRGLFRTTYFSTYEAHEESSKSANNVIDKRFSNIEAEPSVVGTKPGHDYSKLDKYGIIRENTIVDDKTILIGLTSNSSVAANTRVDESKTTKKGQVGLVDKTFITDGEEGQRIAKVRLLEQRIPAIGDKMASRAGQKGTIGLVIPERDMPFTKDGIQPDMIINPHAIPSRMTIGQLVECITGKACAIYGGFGDCTAFNNRGSKIGIFGEMLSKVGFHSSGSEVLYNGMTGDQIETEIFMGPTYYMRLKHMVKDKINYRALGPRAALTKQPVGGRANDGGLRIGEMERDSVISHGATNFLRESMMERGDKSYLAVCNKTGMTAIYNPSKNLFMSPMADGPIKMTGSVENDDLRVEHITKFGRNYSVVCVPYSLKLLIQELQTMNIQMRIITEDNIEQLENMSFSDNIGKLMYDSDIPTRTVVNMIQEALEKSKLKAAAPVHVMSVQSPTPESPKYQTDVSPAYDPRNDPDYIPPENLVNPDSPVYNPNGSYESQVYNPNSPGSPAYVSPVYNPNSPGSPKYENGTDADALDTEKTSAVPIEDYVIGDEVYYRGDSKQTRIWKIKNIADTFLTIHTIDSEGLDANKMTEVVMPYEIYRTDGVIFHGGGQPQFQYPQNQNQDQSQNQNNQSLQPIQHQPAIHFAPSFKFINGGNDLSTGTNDNNNNNNNNNSSNDNNNSDDQMQGGNTMQMNDNVSNQNQNKAQNKNDNEPINFSNFQIRKLG